MNTPKVLSVHVTPECNLQCPFCYVSSYSKTSNKGLEWFYDVPKVASELGIEQIAIGGGEVTLHPKFLHKFTTLCRDYEIIPNLTTNGTNLINLSTLANLGCVSFSYDKYKVSQLGWFNGNKNNSVNNVNSDSGVLDNLVKTVDRAKSLSRSDVFECNPTVGINYLMMDKQDLYNLPKLVKTFLLDLKVDRIYALQFKNNKIDYSTEDLKKVLYPLSFLLKDRICVDDSIMLQLGKKKACHKGDNYYSLDYMGNVRGCSFSEPVTRIDKVSELKDVVNSMFPTVRCTECPYLCT